MNTPHHASKNPAVYTLLIYETNMKHIFPTVCSFLSKSFLKMSFQGRSWNYNDRSGLFIVTWTQIYHSGSFSQFASVLNEMNKVITCRAKNVTFSVFLILYFQTFAKKLASSDLWMMRSFNDATRDEQRHLETTGSLIFIIHSFSVSQVSRE